MLNYPKLIHVYSKYMYRIKQINILCYVNVCILSINLNSIKKKTAINKTYQQGLWWW